MRTAQPHRGWAGWAGACLGLVAAGLWPGQAADSIRLIVRGDDLGSSHAANVACIRAFRDGIVRSVEVMVPGPWYPEAVRMLQENPGLDAGVHLVLTSEWENVKWRPLTSAPSLVDSNGYFYPMVWPNPNFPPGAALQKAAWKIEEVERELRAQIETARRHIPRLSHLSSHMGATMFDPALAALTRQLAEEYHLGLESPGPNLKGFHPWTNAKSAEDRIRQTIRSLEALTPGTYLFVEHPGLDVPEMQAIGHKGYEDVAADREAVTRVFTNPEIKEAIARKSIRLLSYREFQEEP